MTQKINSILLTDDDPDDQFLFQEALFEADKSVSFHGAYDGIDVLEKLKSGAHKPDLLFLDVNMPRMNGIDCLKELQKLEHLREIPVIMYSTSSYYKKECFENGAADYIEKLDDFSKLCAKLKDILDKGLPFQKSALPDSL
jgi:CheY-like chemotaxis protein